MKLKINHFSVLPTKSWYIVKKHSLLRKETQSYVINEKTVLLRDRKRRTARAPRIFGP